MFEFHFRPDDTRFEERCFAEADSPDYLDDALTWVEGEAGVAIVQPRDTESCAIMPVDLYRRLDDIAHVGSYLPHWELDGFAVVDMPTVRDILIGADDELLMECVSQVLGDALHPGGSADLVGARDYLRRTLDVVRRFDSKSCDSFPIIVLPRQCHRKPEDAEHACLVMQTLGLSLTDVLSGNVHGTDKLRRYWWSDVLGYKAWLGGVSIRDQHLSLAWLLCKMQKDGLVDYGIWMGDRPASELADEYVRDLNVGADSELEGRLRDLARRIRDPKDLVTISFEMEQDVYDWFAAECSAHGLSIQNGAHIAIRRFISDPNRYLSGLEPDDIRS